MAEGKTPSAQVSVWLGDEFRSEVAAWAKHERHTSLSSAVKTLAQRGLDAIALPADLLQEIDRRRFEHGQGILELTPTRNQFAAALLRTALGKTDGPQGALDFGSRNASDS